VSPQLKESTWVCRVSVSASAAPIITVVHTTAITMPRTGTDTATGATGIPTGIIIGTTTDAEGKPQSATSSSGRARILGWIETSCCFAKRDVGKQTVNDASQSGRTGAKALPKRDFIG
jgi:hypothetical protein